MYMIDDIGVERATPMVCTPEEELEEFVIGFVDNAYQGIYDKVTSQGIIPPEPLEDGWYEGRRIAFVVNLGMITGAFDYREGRTYHDFLDNFYYPAP